MKLLIFFTIGFILDVLGVIDFKATQHNKAFLAASIGLIAEYTGFIVFFYIISFNINNIEQGLIEIFSYCLGGAVGAFIMIRRGYAKSQASKAKITRLG